MSMESILGYALGDVAPELVQDLTVTLPNDHLPGWSAREAATTTGGLLAVATHQTTCPWTTLLVTPWLSGAEPLGKTLIHLKLKWPFLRIAVLFGAPAPEYRPLLTTLAAYQIYNCLIAEEFQYDDLVQLVTADWTWDRVQPFLAVPEGLTPPLPDTMPKGIVLRRTETDTPFPSRSVAVVSAQGRSGKTGFIANALWATASATSLALDLDVYKPALPLYFRAANDPYPVHLQQLLVGLSKPLVNDGQWDGIDRLTPQDRQEVREYLHRAVVVTPGAQLVPGPLRYQTMTPRLLPGLVGEMIRQAKKMAAVVWVDLPAQPSDPLWEEAVHVVDTVIIIMTTDSLAVLETLALLERLDRLRVPRSAVHILINPMNKGGRSPQEIATVHLRHPVMATLPYQPRQWEAAFASHRPVAQHAPNQWAALVRPFLPTKVSEANMTSSPSVPPQRKGWLKTRRRKPVKRLSNV